MAKVSFPIIKRIIQQYIKNLKPYIKIEKVILFGSTSRRTTHRDSDIDLIIISPDFKKMKFMERLIWLSKMRKDLSLSRAMDIFGYTKEEFEKFSQESIILQEAKEEGKIIE